LLCGRRHTATLMEFFPPSDHSRALRVTVRRGARVLLVALTSASLLVSAGCRPAVGDWLFSVTGEETLAGQTRGLAQLALNLTHPRPHLAPDTPVEYAGRPPFGVNVFLEQEVEQSKRERSLQMLSEAGFTWMRQEFPWEDIEIHGKGDFEDRRHEPHRSAWEKYDHIVGLADQYDVEILARLSNPPAWARRDGDARGTYAPPDNLADWGDYVHALASRYAGSIRYYQLWNEPNIYPEWGEQPVDPEAYTRLLCEGYHRIKEADPDAVVVAGALAPTVSLDRGPGPGLGMGEFVFLQRMYDAGAAACFDVLSVNDYMLWSGPTDHRMRPLNINFSRPAYVRDMMVANGDATTPLWISEMNSNAVPNDPTIHGWGAFGQVTPEQQARYAVLAYERVIEDWPWAGLVNFWFLKRASDAEKNQSWYYFRMVEPDFTPLPVYDAMRAYTSGLRPVLHSGTYQEDHWALTYCRADESSAATASTGDACTEDNGWATVLSEAVVYGPSYRRAAGPGSTMWFSYEGAGLTLAPGPGSGLVEVVVDEGEARQVKLDGRPVRLDGGGLRIWLPGDRSERHEVFVRVLEGEVGVDAVRVERSTMAWAWIAAAAVVLGCAMTRALRRKRLRNGPTFSNRP